MLTRDALRSVAQGRSSEIAPQYQKFETSGLTFSAGGEPKPVVFELKARGR